MRFQPLKRSPPPRSHARNVIAAISGLPNVVQFTRRVSVGIAGGRFERVSAGGTTWLEDRVTDPSWSRTIEGDRDPWRFVRYRVTIFSIANIFVHLHFMPSFQYKFRLLKQFCASLVFVEESSRKVSNYRRDAIVGKIVWIYRSL